MSTPDTLAQIPVLRLVPKDSDALHGFAQELGWRNTRVISGNEETPREIVYETKKPGTVVHWIEDPKIGVDYLAIAGSERDAAAAELRAIREFYSLSEMIVAASEAEPDEKMAAIYYLALLAPDKLDERVFDIFSRYLRDEEADVRGAAVLAISYVGWPEFIVPLQPLVTRDPDETVRQDAGVMIANLKRYPARSLLAKT